MRPRLGGLMSKYRPKTDRKNGHSKPTTLPPKFKPGFLTTLDARTNIAKALRANRDEIVSDIGGLAEIGHIKLSLVERFVLAGDRSPDDGGRDGQRVDRQTGHLDSGRQQPLGFGQSARRGSEGSRSPVAGTRRAADKRER